ncbi:MAG: lipopolysaccharide biosynthesis protein [Balneolales bacterium]|nr:lipopolysaccharide biosynthesis protein [Balneolales bacterium]
MRHGRFIARYFHTKWFERNHLSEDLKGRSVQGGVRTVGAQLFSFTVNIVTTIFLARLLLPEDYGLIAMVTAFTGFILIFKDLGMAQAIIQKDGLTQRLVSMVFWFNFFVSILLGLIIVAMGPLLVWFYDEPRLFNIAALYSFAALFGGLSTQHSALLSRQMKFGELASITMAASFFSLMPALYMAWAGYGYWALVAINILNPAITCVMLWVKCDWRPSFSRIDSRIKEMVGFGAGISGFSMINYFSRNLDNVLIGRYIGTDALGLYSKAYQILMLPITQLRDPLNAVGIPALSALAKEPEKFRNYYREYVFLLAFFSMPIVVFLFVTANPIILFLLGENWIQAAGIFQLLAITAFIQPVASSRGMVMIASGLSTRYFFWGVWNAIFVTIAFVAGIQFGLNGLVIAYAISNYLILIPSLYYCFHKTPVRVKDFFVTIAPVTFISLVAGVFLYAVYVRLPELNLWLEIFVLGLVYGLSYVILWLPMPSTRARLTGVVGLARSILKK